MSANKQLSTKKVFRLIDAAYKAAQGLSIRQNERESDRETASAFLSDLRALVAELDDCVNGFEHLR